MPPHSRGKQPQAITDFCARVKLLVNRYDDGNVSAAARRLRVSQRGLQKVYQGVTTEPRLTFVQALLRVYRGADARWLLLGDESNGGLADHSFDAAVESQAKVLLRRLIEDMHNSPVAVDAAPAKRRKSG